MAVIKRFSTVRQGGIVFTGNTLGLAPAVSSSGGFAGSIAVFTSLDTSLQVSGFPAGTTLDYTKNGSAAVLNLPADATVIYAELVWGGLYRYGNTDITALTDNAVSFTTLSQTLSITGDPVTRANLLLSTGAGGGNVGFYVRSAVVTQAVKTAMSGTYSVQQVPALIANPSAQSSDTNHVGWTLAVVYESPSAPLRSLTFWGGATPVSLAQGSTDITVSGFLTPETPPISAKLFVSAQEGDAVISGDRMLFGGSVATLQPLSGPNNPETNFFASQINNSAGLVDTSGTFGTRNASAQTGLNTTACRQGWDITAVDLSSLIQTSQTSAAIRMTTSGDLYLVNGLAVQIDSKGANVNVVKSADRTFVSLGGEVEYTLTVSNSGSADATNVIVSDPLPAGLTLVAGSVTLDGAPYAGGLPVSIPTIAAGATATVTFRAKSTSLPAVNPTVNRATADYSFSPFTGITVSASAESNPVNVQIIYNNLIVTKDVDKTYAVKGDELTYFSVVTNGGNVDIQNAVFNDSAPAGTTFVPDSVILNGVPLAGADPAAGISLGAIPVGGTETVSFRVTIN